MDLDHTVFEAKSPIIPTPIQANFGSDATIQKGVFNTLSLLGGYGHSFVYHNFYLTPAFMLGKGLQSRRYEVSNVETNSLTNSTKINLAINVGYNGESFFSGLNFGIDQIEFKTGSLHLKTGLEVFRLTIGRRF
jgi:hypothetical protein